MKNDTPKKLSVSLDYRVIIVLLLAVIATMLIVWKPWSQIQDDNRVIEVTGEATIKAEPDEYVFTPSYQFKNTDKDEALSELSAKSDEIIAGLKKLGVTDSNIKTNSSGYDFYGFYYDPGSKTNNYTLQLTITLDSRELAQKIQDYLVGTSPMGNISPRATFSEAKRKELESQARDEATKDARAKAEQSGKNLGFSIGKVKAVNDGSGFGDVVPYSADAAIERLDSASKPSLSVQPGENELRYSVTVVYYLR